MVTRAWGKWKSQQGVVSEGMRGVGVVSSGRAPVEAVGGGRGLTTLPRRFNPGVGLSQVPSLPRTFARGRFACGVDVCGMGYVDSADGSDGGECVCGGEEWQSAREIERTKGVLV